MAVLVTACFLSDARAGEAGATTAPSELQQPNRIVQSDPPAHFAEFTRAFSYLKDHLQDRDKAIGDDFLKRHVEAILAGRATQPWAGSVPPEIFDEYVLPFATLDEPREAWINSVKPVATELVRGAKTCGQAAVALNDAIFERLRVRYHPTKRPRPNQSVSESTSCGFASCTGLSILLVNSCRSVGVPARIVGVADWISPKGPTFQGGGNHTWVEIWDGRQWRFLGASEKSPLDQTWFASRASQANESTPRHALFATCFAESGDHFPMVWSPDDTTVPAINVTRYYTDRKTVHVDAPADAQLMIRDAGRLVAAGAPGDFILAGDRSYSLEIVRSDGSIHRQTLRAP